MAGMVVGYDGSPRAGTAVDWAVGEASRRRAPLLVLNATRPRGAEETAERLARDGAARAHGSLGDVDVRWGTARGDVPRALCDAATGADLVVLGPGRHGALADGFLGSVARYVSGHAGCPTVVVRGTPDAGAIGPVVVGVDGSPASLAALRFAADEAVRDGVPLAVLAAWRSTAAETEAEVYAGTTVPGRAARAADEVARTVEGMLAHSHPSLDVDTLVVAGAPAKVLADVSSGAGMVVVGTHGHGSRTWPLSRSVGHACVHDCDCPVALVRG
jgi:nucleotide-binding universal stress UspA family protein